MKTKHKACEVIYQEGWKKMLDFVEKSFENGNFQSLRGQLLEIARNHFRTENDVEDVLATVWERMVDHFLNDGNLDESEERILASFIWETGLSEEKLNRKGAYEKFKKGRLLRKVVHGEIEQFEGPVPVILGKSEVPVWVFRSVENYEMRKRKEYAGGYSGLSIRIARGVYYRVGGFKGTPVEKTELTHVDKGTLVLTSKNLYFVGQTRSYKIPYEKIISVIPYKEGIMVYQDAKTKKPQFFELDDVWFSYNLLVNLISQAKT
ncbi:MULTISPECIES: hypothetical protein [unclassified Thermotoga]|uniref:hypothetical protein n=1 Tax=unclassified Thermotoga TaxID=2631113 RepID=UPI001E2A3C99|nr:MULTISPECIES: hypothetical protein [unclassified Thermotoga]